MSIRLIRSYSTISRTTCGHPTPCPVETMLARTGPCWANLVSSAPGTNTAPVSGDRTTNWLNRCGALWSTHSRWTASTTSDGTLHFTYAEKMYFPGSGITIGVEKSDRLSRDILRLTLPCTAVVESILREDSRPACHRSRQECRKAEVIPLSHSEAEKVPSPPFGACDWWSLSPGFVSLARGFILWPLSGLLLISSLCLAR